MSSDKVYYGINPVKGKRPATQIEAMDKNQIRYWGLHQANKKIIESHKINKQIKSAINKGLTTGKSAIDEKMIEKIYKKLESLFNHSKELSKQYDLTGDSDYIKMYQQIINKYNKIANIFYSLTGTEIKPIVKPDVLPSQEKAATKIQSLFRGMKARKELKKLKDAKQQEVKKLQEEEKAATKIQSLFRGFKARKELKKQEEAATTIQRAFRKNIKTKEEAFLKKQKEEKEKRDKSKLKKAKKELQFTMEKLKKEEAKSKPKEELLTVFESKISNALQEINKIEKKQEEEKKEEVKVATKGEQFSYSPEWKKEIHDLYKSVRKTNTKEFKNRQDLLFQLQKEYDLFPTPEDLSKGMINDFMKNYNKNDVYNILEPSLGLGSLLFPFIDRQNDISINKIDGIEYSKQLYNIVKDKINISNYYNGDFLEIKQERLYNLILMNPPYRGTVILNDKYQSEKEVYWYHIIKALLLDYGNYEKTIYLICPKIHNKLESNNIFEPTINASLEKRLKTYFNIDTDENILSNTQFKMLKESKGEFNSFDSKGNPTKMNYTIYLYRIDQCCSNKKIVIEKSSSVKDLNPAATKIQSLFRMRKAQKELKKLKEATQQEKAATKIQSLFRGMKARKELKKQEAKQQEPIDLYTFLENAITKLGLYTDDRWRTKTKEQETYALELCKRKYKNDCRPMYKEPMDPTLKTLINERSSYLITHENIKSLYKDLTDNGRINYEKLDRNIIIDDKEKIMNILESIYEDFQKIKKIKINISDKRKYINNYDDKINSKLQNKDTKARKLQIDKLESDKQRHKNDISRQEEEIKQITKNIEEKADNLLKEELSDLPSQEEAKQQKNKPLTDEISDRTQKIFDDIIWLMNNDSSQEMNYFKLTGIDRLELRKIQNNMKTIQTYTERYNNIKNNYEFLKNNKKDFSSSRVKKHIDDEMNKISSPDKLIKMFEAFLKAYNSKRNPTIHDKEEAATKIQSLFRGMKARKELKKLKEEKKAKEQKKLEDLTLTQKTIIYNAIYIAPYEYRSRFEKIIPRIQPENKGTIFTFRQLPQDKFKDPDQLVKPLENILNGIDLDKNVKNLLY